MLNQLKIHPVDAGVKIQKRLNHKLMIWQKERMHLTFCSLRCAKCIWHLF